MRAEWAAAALAFVGWRKKAWWKKMVAEILASEMVFFGEWVE